MFIYIFLVIVGNSCFIIGYLVVGNGIVIIGYM